MKHRSFRFVFAVCSILISGIFCMTLSGCSAGIEPKYVFSDSMYLYDPENPHVHCIFADYVFIGRVEEYLGGVALDPQLDMRVGTLFRLENFENLKGDLELGELALVKDGGLTRDEERICLCEEGDYFPEIGSYCIFLAMATNRQILFSGAAGIDVIELNVEETEDRGALLDAIRQTPEYLAYQAGIADPDPEVLEEVAARQRERYTSVFAQDAADEQTKSAFFKPDWKRNKLSEILPHEPVKREKQQPEYDPELVSEMQEAVYEPES